MNTLCQIILVWNIVVFITYGMDKAFAKAGSRRISERTLFTMASLLGGIGAFLGMQLFRHKTRHLSFKTIIPMLALVTLGVIVLLGGDILWIK